MTNIKLPGRNPNTQEMIVRQSSMKTAVEFLQQAYGKVDFNDEQKFMLAITMTKTVAEDIERWVNRKVDPRDNND